MFNVGLEERFGGGIVEGFYVGLDVPADTLEGSDEAVEKRGCQFPIFLGRSRSENLLYDRREQHKDVILTPR